MILQAGDTVAFGGITLGQTDANGVEWYFLDLQGWGSTASTAKATAKASGDGAFLSPAFLDKRTLSVAGAIVAPSKPALVAAWDQLQAAAVIVLQPVTVTHGGAVRYVMAARQGEILWKPTSPQSIEFTVTFIAPDPRKFSSALQGSAGLPLSSNGLTVPFTIPFTINSTLGGSGYVQLTNPGNAVGPVVFTISSGAVTGPIITHSTTGTVFAMQPTFALNAGDSLVVDANAQTVVLNASASRYGSVLTYGWPGFAPGANRWALTAASGDTNVRLNVSATPAWL